MSKQADRRTSPRPLGGTSLANSAFEHDRNRGAGLPSGLEQGGLERIAQALESPREWRTADFRIEGEPGAGSELAGAGQKIAEKTSKSASRSVDDAQAGGNAREAATEQAEQAEMQFFASLEDIEAAGFARLGTGLYLSASRRGASSDSGPGSDRQRREAHPIWELRQAEDGDGYLLVRKREERLVDLRPTASRRSAAGPDIGEEYSEEPTRCPTCKKRLIRPTGEPGEWECTECGNVFDWAVRSPEEEEIYQRTMWFPERGDPELEEKFPPKSTWRRDPSKSRTRGEGLAPHKMPPPKKYRRMSKKEAAGFVSPTMPGTIPSAEGPGSFDWPEEKIRPQRGEEWTEHEIPFGESELRGTGFAPTDIGGSLPTELPTELPIPELVEEEDEFESSEFEPSEFPYAEIPPMAEGDPLESAPPLPPTPKPWGKRRTRAQQNHARPNHARSAVWNPFRRRTQFKLEPSQAEGMFRFVSPQDQLVMEDSARAIARYMKANDVDQIEYGGQMLGLMDVVELDPEYQRFVQQQQKIGQSGAQQADPWQQFKPQGWDTWDQEQRLAWVEQQEQMPAEMKRWFTETIGKGYEPQFSQADVPSHWAAGLATLAASPFWGLWKGFTRGVDKYVDWDWERTKRKEDREQQQQEENVRQRVRELALPDQGTYVQDAQTGESVQFLGLDAGLENAVVEYPSGERNTIDPDTFWTLYRRTGAPASTSQTASRSGVRTALPASQSNPQPGMGGMTDANAAYSGGAPFQQGERIQGQPGSQQEGQQGTISEISHGGAGTWSVKVDYDDGSSWTYGPEVRHYVEKLPAAGPTAPTGPAAPAQTGQPIAPAGPTAPTAPTAPAAMSASRKSNPKGKIMLRRGSRVRTIHRGQAAEAVVVMTHPTEQALDILLNEGTPGEELVTDMPMNMVEPLPDEPEIVTLDGEMPAGDLVPYGMDDDADLVGDFLTSEIPPEDAEFEAFEEIEPSDEMTEIGAENLTNQSQGNSQFSSEIPTVGEGAQVEIDSPDVELEVDDADDIEHETEIDGDGGELEGDFALDPMDDAGAMDDGGMMLDDVMGLDEPHVLVITLQDLSPTDLGVGGMQDGLPDLFDGHLGDIDPTALEDDELFDSLPVLDPGADSPLESLSGAEFEPEISPPSMAEDHAHPEIEEPFIEGPQGDGAEEDVDAEMSDGMMAPVSYEDGMYGVEEEDFEDFEEFEDEGEDDDFEDEGEDEGDDDSEEEEDLGFGEPARVESEQGEIREGDDDDDEEEEEEEEEESEESLF